MARFGFRKGRHETERPELPSRLPVTISLFSPSVLSEKTGQGRADLSPTIFLCTHERIDLLTVVSSQSRVCLYIVTQIIRWTGRRRSWGRSFPRPEPAR